MAADSNRLGPVSQQPDGPDAEQGGAFDVAHAAIIAVLSAVATAVFLFVDITVADVLGMQLQSLLSAVIPLLVVLPLPAAYVATLSRDRFRVESLGGVAAVIVAAVSAVPLLVGLGLFAGLLLTSYKAENLFQGETSVYLEMKAVGTTATIVGLGIAAAVTMAYADDPGFRQGVQGNMTAETVDFTMQHVQGVTKDLAADREQQLVDAARRYAETAAEGSVELTGAIILQDIRDTGLFNATHMLTLQQGLETARQRVPANVSQSVEQRVEQELQQRNTSAVLPDRGEIETRASGIVDRFTQPTTPVLVIIFVSVFSLVLALRIPFGLIGAIYGGIFARLLTA